MIGTAARWVEVVRCPICLGELVVDGLGREFACPGCGVSFPLVGNIPVMVAGDLALAGVKEREEFRAQVREHGEAYEAAGTPEKVRRRVADLLEKHGIGMSSRGRILEIGCGPFESLHDAPGEIKIGVDPLATSYASQLPVPRTKSALVEAFAEVLPFQDAFFDVLVSRNSFDHLNDPELALLEFRRVLAGKGRCVIECYVDSDPFVAHEPFVLTEPFIERIVTRSFDILGMRRIPRGGRYVWDWIELVLEPKASAPPHRPYGPGVFRDVAHSYLELFSRGWALVAKGEYERGIEDLLRSVEKKRDYFWSAAGLLAAYLKGGRRAEAAELKRTIERDIRDGAYPCAVSPEEALAAVAGQPRRGRLRDRMAHVFGAKGRYDPGAR